MAKKRGYEYVVQANFENFGEHPDVAGKLIKVATGLADRFTKLTRSRPGNEVKQPESLEDFFGPRQSPSGLSTEVKPGKNDYLESVFSTAQTRSDFTGKSSEYVNDHKAVDSETKYKRKHRRKST